MSHGMAKLEYEKIELQKGNDEPIRTLYASEIEKVLIASARGEIGFGSFIQDIRALLNGMESVCNKHWIDFIK